MAYYTPRLTCPARSNKYYIRKANGGYSDAINISGGFVLPNCVGYANGRSLEISGGKGIFPACNAKNFISRAKQLGLSTGTTPKLGAIAVWGATSGNAYGHVGVVEVISGNTLTIAQSNYGGTIFFLSYHNKGSMTYNGMPFLGYVYNPYAPASAKPTTTSTTTTSSNSGINMGVKVATKYAKSLAGTYTADCNVNLRSGCGTNYSSKVVIPKGASMFCSGYYTPTNTKYPWFYVGVTVKGKYYEGFVQGEYITVKK